MSTETKITVLGHGQVAVEPGDGAEPYVRSTHERTDAALVALVRTLMDTMGLDQLEQHISHARLRIRMGGVHEGVDALARELADKLAR